MIYKVDKYEAFSKHINSDNIIYNLFEYKKYLHKDKEKMSRIELKDVIMIIISALALLSSIALGVPSIVMSKEAKQISVEANNIALKEYENQVNERYKLEAPLLIVASMKFNPNYQDYEFPKIYSPPPPGKFIFLKRILTNKTFESRERKIALVINICSENISYVKDPLINFTTVTLENCGFDLMYMEINSVKISFKDNSIPELNLIPTAQNSLHQRITYNTPIEISFSIYYNNISLFDEELMKNSDFINTKILETDGELLNSTLSPMADLWKEITIGFIIKNLYGIEYNQEIILSTQNNTYTATSIFINDKK